jgi:hypothetical protein
MARLTKRDLVAYDDYLRGKGHTKIQEEKLDTEAVIKEFNEKWATYIAIKN